MTKSICCFCARGFTTHLASCSKVAVGTRIRLLARVHALMRPEIRLLSGAIVAHVALERLLARVNALVFVEVTPVVCAKVAPEAKDMLNFTRANNTHSIQQTTGGITYTLHENGFSPVCTRMCVFMVDFCAAR